MGGRPDAANKMPESELHQLVDETIELTGAAAPELLDADAPVLVSDRAVIRSEVGPVYLIGLIGGKEVGKSSLVNALVGADITPRSSFGEGTGGVIAYAHESAAEELRPLLEREVPGKHRVVTHRLPALRRQVLLDLPDIDSRWAEHVQITRRMLRHLLYPLWIQSVEKYADQQPQSLLKQVAAGNDPANFLFCLNKADQLIGRSGERAAAELRDDFSARLRATLSLSSEPHVYLLSAVRPDALDLPDLRRALSSEKTETAVAQAIDLAGKRRERSLVSWLRQQDLPRRAERAGRLLTEAQELTSSRIGVPLMERAVPRLAADPAQRMWLVEPAIAARMARWPIVNVIQLALSPLVALVRKNLSPVGSPVVGEGAVASAGAAAIDAHFTAATGRSVATMVQTTFAQLRQIEPEIANLYAHEKLWDDAPAALAAGELSRRLSDTVQRQRDSAVEAVSGNGFTSALFAPVRWLLTIGAALWFPLIQPVLERVLVDGFLPQPRDLAKLVVPLLGAQYLLQSAAFLLLWFFGLWLAIRWSTHRRMSRLTRRWAAADVNSDVSLTGQCARWLDDLLAPLTRSAERARSLAARVRAAEKDSA